MQNSKRHNKHSIQGKESWKYNYDGMYDMRFKGDDKRVQIKKLRLTEQEMIEDGLEEYYEEI